MPPIQVPQPHPLEYNVRKRSRVEDDPLASQQMSSGREEKFDSYGRQYDYGHPGPSQSLSMYRQAMPGHQETSSLNPIQQDPPGVLHHQQSDRDLYENEQNSMVGKPGFPLASPRPLAAKSKFTVEDDDKLRLLKEEKKLTWRQIADFFPGRTSGTLQVRYCTKLRKKEANWTDESENKLLNAIADYERDRFKILAQKLGPGFSKDDVEAKYFQMKFDGRVRQSDASAPSSP